MTLARLTQSGPERRLLRKHRTEKNRRRRNAWERSEKIRATVTLENTWDRGVFRRGQGQEADIRRTSVDGMVDTGSVSLILAQEVVERLGLEEQGTAVLTYADERQDERAIAGPVTVQIGNRSMVTDCVVGPAQSEALIGQVVLERLDLIADCRNHTLAPRNPDHPVLKAKALTHLSDLPCHSPGGK